MQIVIFHFQYFMSYYHWRKIRVYLPTKHKSLKVSAYVFFLILNVISTFLRVCGAGTYSWHRRTNITSNFHGLIDLLLCIYSSLLLQNRSLLFFFTLAVCTSEICETLKMFRTKICFKFLFMSRILNFSPPSGYCKSFLPLAWKKKKFLIQRTRLKIKGWSERVKSEKVIIKLWKRQFLIKI